MKAYEKLIVIIELDDNEVNPLYDFTLRMSKHIDGMVREKAITAEKGKEFHMIANRIMAALQEADNGQD